MCLMQKYASERQVAFQLANLISQAQAIPTFVAKCPNCTAAVWSSNWSGILRLMPANLCTALVMLSPLRGGAISPPRVNPPRFMAQLDRGLCGHAGASPPLPSPQKGFRAFGCLENSFPASSTLVPGKILRPVCIHRTALRGFTSMDPWTAHRFCRSL
jgi:hypothetical protein